MKVAIIEDQAPIREGLAALIDGTEGFACSGAYGSMEEALPRLVREPPDVVLVDLGLPGMSGLEGIAALRRGLPSLPLLVLSVYEDDERVFEALCAGATGYLVKKTPPDRLLEALRDAAAGGSPISPGIARRVIALFNRFRPPGRADYGLTPHETRLLGLLVEGHGYKSAAAELGVSVNTVSFHMRRVYEKLQVHSKSEAVAKALRNNLIR